MVLAYACINLQTVLRLSVLYIILVNFHIFSVFVQFHSAYSQHTLNFTPFTLGIRSASFCGLWYSHCIIVWLYHDKNITNFYVFQIYAKFPGIHSASFCVLWYSHCINVWLYHDKNITNLYVFQICICQISFQVFSVYVQLNSAYSLYLLNITFFGSQNIKTPLQYFR